MIHNGVYISDNISYSLIKRFDEEGPRGLINPKKIENSGVRYGTLLDDYLFMEKEDFYNKYKISSVTIPPMLEKLAYKITKIVKYEEIDKIKNNDILKKKIVKIMIKEKMYSNIKKEETFIKKFNYDEFYDYCKELYENKTLVHIREFMKVQEGKNSLYTHEKTRSLFTNNNENIYQLEIKFDYLGQKVKCFLDMVIIDHENKIIKGIDLKTGSPQPEEFMTSYFKYKYYLQSAIYNKALEYYNEKMFNGEYTIDNFRFLYLSKFDLDNPLIYVVSEKWINAGIKGFTTASGYYYKGFDQLVKEITWHKENKIFNLSRDAFEKPEIYLEDNFINIHE